MSVPCKLNTIENQISLTHFNKKMLRLMHSLSKRLAIRFTIKLMVKKWLITSVSRKQHDHIIWGVVLHIILKF